MGEQLIVQANAPWWQRYLAPSDVLWEWVIGAVIAFIVVQCIKNSRRSKPGMPKLTRFQLMTWTVPVAFAAIFPPLYFVHPYGVIASMVYSVQGAILSPLVITILLAILSRVAPDLRRSLSQNRRDGPRKGPEHRGENDEDDETHTRYL